MALELPNTVTTFAFQVLVDAASPQEHTVLRWSRQRGAGVYTAVWGATGSNVFAGSGQEASVTIAEGRTAAYGAVGKVQSDLEPAE